MSKSDSAPIAGRHADRPIIAASAMSGEERKKRCYGLLPAVTRFKPADPARDSGEFVQRNPRLVAIHECGRQIEVGKAECACDPIPIVESGFQNGKKLICGFPFRFDYSRIRIAHAEFLFEEQLKGQLLHRRAKVDGLPPGPLIDEGPRLEAIRIGPRLGPDPGQIGTDRPGFPKHEIPVLQNRHLCIGIAGKKFRRAVVPGTTISSSTPSACATARTRSAFGEKFAL